MMNKEDDEEDNTDEDNINEEDDEDGEETIKKKSKEPKEIDESMFFSPEAMESFIEEAENEEQGLDFTSSDEEQVQSELYGKAGNRENEAENLHYDDWFANPGEHRRNRAESDPIESQIESEKSSLYKPVLSRFEQEQVAKQSEITEAEKELLNEDDTDLSKHQQKQRRMAQKIKKLEEQNLDKKSWVLSGETGGYGRPMNSLLEEDLDYDFATKLPPVITEEVTKSLEDIIRYRIQENAFDDVVKKEAPKEKRKREEVKLDSNKSKKSLSEIYEEEFKKTTAKDKKKDPAEEKKKFDYTQRKALHHYKKLLDQLDTLVGVINPKD